MTRVALPFLIVALSLNCDQAPKSSENNAMLVSSVSVDASQYTRGCDSHSDCALVPTSYRCTSRSNCDYEGVLAEHEATVLQALEDQKPNCSDSQEFWGINAFTTGECYDEQRVACNRGTCEAVGLGGCLEDADCLRNSDLWRNSTLVSCYPDFSCRECIESGPYEQSDCPDGMYCERDQCLAFATCTTSADCPEVEIGKRLGCAESFCRPCVADGDCAPDAVCTLPNPGFDPLPLGGCYETQWIDDACLDGTCPWSCSKAGQIRWECRGPQSNNGGEDPYPGVEFPELSDFDTSCAGDADCTSVPLRLWSTDCKCACDTAGLNTAGAQAYADAWPDTKTLFGCEAEPDCPCQPGPIVCGTEARCVPP